MPLRAAKWIVSRRLQATHIGGCGRWSGFGTTLRGGIRKNSLSQPANGSSTNIRAIASMRVLPHVPLLLAVHEEAAQLGLRARLPGAKLEPAVGDQVERRGALHDARGVVHARRDLDDAVPEADALGARRGGGQEDLRRRGVRVLLEEVVLDLPDVVEADPVGQLHLGERVLEERVLGALAVPGAGILVLIKDSETHGSSVSGFLHLDRCGES